MKKKLAVIAGTALLVSSFILIPSARSFAISALSVFRVNDTKTINITVTDIQEMSDYYAPIAENNLEQWKEIHDEVDVSEFQKHEPNIRDISYIGEIEEFRVKLPRDLKEEVPVMKASEAKSVNFKIDTDKINKALGVMGITDTLDEKYNNQELDIQFPPVFTAKYNDVLLMETQGVYVKSSGVNLNEMYQELLGLPFLSENLRSQLAQIDLDKRDVYLPVIMGIGREIAIGSNTGYVYSGRDVEQSMYTLAGDKMEEYGELSEAADSEDASVLIWTDDGVLYCLAGAKTDSELAKIARSIR